MVKPLFKNAFLGLLVMSVTGCSILQFAMGEEARKKGDYCEAIKWYKQAAAQGHSGAQNNLGLYYEEGKCLPKDFQMAKNLYEKAMVQGESAAEYNLARYYHHPVFGFPQDRAKAKYLYTLSCQKGYQKACDGLRTYF